MKKSLPFLLLSLIVLSGCTLNPMIIDNPKGKLINGNKVTVDNINKIPDKEINLKFKINPLGEIEDFPWEEVEKEVRDSLKNKGVALTSSGREVTVTLEKFIAHGSHTAERQIKSPGLLGGQIASATGSFVAGILVNLVDKTINQTKGKTLKGDGKHFVPEIEFKVESNNFQSNVNLHFTEAMSGYIGNTVANASSSISEFFEPANNQK